MSLKIYPVDEDNELVIIYDDVTDIVKIESNIFNNEVLFWGGKIKKVVELLQLLDIRLGQPND